MLSDRLSLWIDPGLTISQLVLYNLLNPTFFVLHRRVTVGFSIQTTQLPFLSSGTFGQISLFDTDSFLSDTSLHLSNWARNTRTACSTIKPAIIAFEVAIAGIMLPAISFTFHCVFCSMLKMAARILAAAATNIIASSSSLSHSKIPFSFRRAENLTFCKNWQ